jgi:hypothetical protein
MKIKKTSLEIKENILIKLESGPKTISEIAEAVSSNWLTIEKFLKELKEDKKVKELISTEKKKVYQIITGDTYFNLPIKDEERKKFRTLFYLILQIYKEKNEIPTKTQLSKCAVEIIKNKESGLGNLPIIWYLYGIIPLMVAEPFGDYNEEIPLENKKAIKKIIQIYMNKNHNISSKELDKQQHKEYGEELYQLADEFKDIIEKDTFEGGLDILNRFYIACPIDENFPEVFNFTDRFFSTLTKLSSFVDLKKYKKEIRSTFDSLWNYIATYKCYQSVFELGIIPNKKLLLEFYIGNVLEARKTCFEELFSELYSIYLSNLKNTPNIEYSEEVQKIREIMQDWTGED